MSIIFSRKCEYGLQAVLYLASSPIGEVFSSNEIAKKLKIPKEFISKILQELTGSGIIASKKGKSGGFSLAKSPSEIKMLDVVLALDGSDLFNKCVLGFPNCSNETPCPLHIHWSQLINQTFNMLSEETIDKLRSKVIFKIDSIQ